MKKLFLVTALLLSAVCAFSATPKKDADSSKETEKTSTIKPLWFNISFNEGLSFGQITRIEVMENRSNFVRENVILGAFVNCKTDDLWVFDLELQLGAYYPIKNAFNGMEQFPKNALNYAVDMFVAGVYSFDDLQYVLLDAALGMHFMYQLTDEYHMCYLGLGLQGTLEFPITRNWTLVNSYFVSYDNPNLGSNAKVQLFDAAYQYHIDLGIRYSKKVTNSYSYIGGK